MKNVQTFTEFINESELNESELNEAKKGFQLASDGSADIYRFSGKTWPNLTYLKKSSSPDIPNNSIVGRDDNGRNPSKTLFTTDLTVGGFKKLLSQGISQPWPTDEQIEEFIKRIK